MMSARSRALTAPLAFAVVLGVAAATAAPAARAQTATFDESQAEAIETIVREYLLEHPEVVMEALNALQARQEAEEMAQQREQLDRLEASVFDSPTSPVVGNPDGDVTLVEFFDYNCGYCKRMREPMMTLIEGDRNLRVVMKEFPILAPSSVTAAQAALASAKQDKYLEFHDALMAHRGQLSDEIVFDVAKSVGLDVDRLKADMDSDEVAGEIQANLQLAQAIGIRGTPAFIIGDEIVPGAVGLSELERLIAAARGS